MDKIHVPLEEKIALWNAINRYANACNAKGRKHGNTMERERAVVAVDREIDAVVARRTPPDADNEALTLEELRGMDGEPVYLIDMQPIEYGWEDSWFLIDADEDIAYNDTQRFDLSQCEGFAYRHKPEGRA